MADIEIKTRKYIFEGIPFFKCLLFAVKNLTTPAHFIDQMDMKVPFCKKEASLFTRVGVRGGELKMETANFLLLPPG
jgi:hypothetical protein